MPYLASLTPEERITKKAGAMGNKKLQFLQNQVINARRHAELLPPTFDLVKLEEDAALTGALFEQASLLEKILADVYDTILVAGSPAVVNAAAAHGYIKWAATTTKRLLPTGPSRKNRSLPTPASPAGMTESNADGSTIRLPVSPDTKAA
jgi:hypothetical protein